MGTTINIKPGNFDVRYSQTKKRGHRGGYFTPQSNRHENMGL